jgi:hypothetical protein
MKVSIHLIQKYLKNLIRKVLIVLLIIQPRVYQLNQIQIMIHRMATHSRFNL